MILRSTRAFVFFCAVIVALMMPVVASAWLYDGGPEQHAGVVIRDGGATVWASAPFVIAEDSYVTKLGAAAAKAYGPVGSHFNVHLLRAPYGTPDDPIATWTLTPVDSALNYYYHEFDSPLPIDGGYPYCLLFEPAATDFGGTISYGVMPGTYYGLGTGDYGETWYQLMYPLCIRVDGYPVPEPSSAVMFLAALCTVHLIWRKARR